MRLSNFLFGLVLGAAAGILLAPETGRRSRAVIRDKTVKYSHDAADFVDKKSRHIANKAKGYAHSVSEAVSGAVGGEKEVVEEEQSASV